MTYRFYELGKEKILQVCLADATTSGSTPVGTYYNFDNLVGNASPHVSISGNVLTLLAGRYFLEGYPYRNNKASTLNMHYQWEQEIDSSYTLVGEFGSLISSSSSSLGDGFRRSAAYVKVVLTQTTNFKLKIITNNVTSSDTIHGYIQVWRES